MSNTPEASVILARRLAQDKRASAVAVDSIGSENAAYGERTNAAPHGGAVSSARRRNPPQDGPAAHVSERVAGSGLPYPHEPTLAQRSGSYPLGTNSRGTPA